MDVKNYGQYFNSAGEFGFSEVRRYSGAVEGYHLLPVNLPFMQDREYFFRVHAGGYDVEDNVSIVHWYLIDEPEKAPFTCHEYCGLSSKNDNYGV